jgi:adenylate cyclase
MKHKPELNRLLDRTAISALLADYVPLLGRNVSLGLIDAHGRQLSGQVGLDETELVRLWELVRDQGAFVAPAGNLAAWPITLADQPLGMLLATGELPPDLEAMATFLVVTLEMLTAEAAAKRAIAQETLDRYREINVLYKVSETLGACLELNQVCQIVLDESIKLIKCRRGAVLLVDPDSAEAPLTPADLTLAAAAGPDGPSDPIPHQALSVAVAVSQSGKPQIVNDFQPPGFPPTPLVCAPLRFQEKVLGVILLAEKISGGDFAADDEKLLLTLATQAASSIENARLFESVKRQHDEIATIKNYLDNIFDSIASGVITTDVDNNITTFNQAAASILSLPAKAVLHRPYQQALAFLSDTPLPALIRDVQQKGQTYIDCEISSHLPTRGQVHLNMSLSRLRGSSQEPLGVTIVVDDVTEKKRFERERRMVRRYLPPELVDSLPEDLDELKLRGERQMITTLFADIRGFTSFSEIHSPEMVVEVINGYFALAAEAVRKHYGIIDKYLGDAVMAVFNTPLLETKNHAWNAVQAAWELKQMIKHYHREVEPELRMNFGMGICTGEAVVGNVGTIDRMEYTAIGDTVNVAKRLQENAAAGQIVMSRSTWELLRNRVHVSRLPPVTLKGRRTPTEVFKLDALIA